MPTARPLYCPNCGRRLRLHRVIFRDTEFCTMGCAMAVSFLTEENLERVLSDSRAGLSPPRIRQPYNFQDTEPEDL